MSRKNPWTSWQKRDLHENVPSSSKKETVEMELLKEQVRNMRVTNARLEVELRAIVDDKCFAAERRKFDLAILREQVRSLKIANDLQEKELKKRA